MVERAKRGVRRTSIGIDRVLYHAAVDPAFCEALLADRDAALAEWSIRLTPREQQVLDRISDASLQHMVAAIEPEKHGRREFFATVAGASALAVGAVELSGCWSDGPTGSRPNPEDGSTTVNPVIEPTDATDLEPVDD